MELNSAAAQIEKQKASILDLMRKLAAIGSRLGAIEIERKNVASQQSRLQQRRSQVSQELDGLRQASEELTAKLKDIAETIARQQTELEGKRH